MAVGGGEVTKKVSVNLCKAIDYAKSVDATILGIVGRSNGYTDQHADICLVIPTINSESITPHSESFQSVVWHLMVSHPSLKENSTKW